MHDVVCDMCEERALRLQKLDIFQRFLYPQVRRVYPETQTIKDQHIEVLQPVDRCLRNLAEIREISEVVKAIGHHRQTTVDHFERCYLQVFTDAKPTAGSHNVRNHHRQTTAEVRRLEDVLEHAPDVDPRALVCMDVERSESKVKRTDIVESEDVIGVAMCD